MIITEADAKAYLRIDFEDDNDLINLEITAAEEYIKNATGKMFDNTNPIARILCLLLVQNMYDNRAFTVTTNEKISIAAEGLLLQLQYCYVEEETV